MKGTTNVAQAIVPGARAAIAAALLGVALVPSVAQAARPSLDLSVGPNPVREGHRSTVGVVARGTISRDAGGTCAVIVSVSGDARIVGSDKLTLVAGDNTSVSGVSVESLQDGDQDDDSVTISGSVACDSNWPVPAEDVPHAPADITLTISDDDKPGTPDR